MERLPRVFIFPPWIENNYPRTFFISFKKVECKTTFSGKLVLHTFKGPRFIGPLNTNLQYLEQYIYVFDQG
jgi:hypothetical protein